jgi:hypothetical protein
VEKASGSINESKGNGNESVNAPSNETVENELHGFAPPEVDGSAATAR